MSSPFQDDGRGVYHRFFDSAIIRSLQVHDHIEDQVDNPAHLEQPFATALQATNIFQRLCSTKPYASPELYPVFALALSRYILDNDWSVISNPQIVDEGGQGFVWTGSASMLSDNANRGVPGTPFIKGDLIGFCKILLLFLPITLAYMALELFPAPDIGPAPLETGSATQTVRLFGGLIVFSMSKELELLLFIVTIAAFGGLLGGIRSPAGHAKPVLPGHKWIVWYFLQTITAAVLGAMFYFVIRAGVFSSRAQADDVNPFGIGIIALVIGLYSGEVIRWLRETSLTLFGTDPYFIEVVKQLDKSVTNQIESLLSEPTLDNFQGVCRARILNAAGTEVPSREDGVSEVSSGQSFQLSVQFHPVHPGSPEPSSDYLAQPISIRDGQNAERVIFEVSLDSDTVPLKDTTQMSVTVAPGAPSPPLLFTLIAPEQSGQHTIWVEVFQKNKLIQVISVPISVDELRSSPSSGPNSPEITGLA
jgi:hypothetical protein